MSRQFSDIEKLDICREYLVASKSIKAIAEKYNVKPIEIQRVIVKMANKHSIKIKRLFEMNEDIADELKRRLNL